MKQAIRQIDKIDYYQSEISLYALMSDSTVICPRSVCVERLWSGPGVAPGSDPSPRRRRSILTQGVILENCALLYRCNRLQQERMV